ncbi:S-adenosylmethionine carrier 1, chloroplastic/mitochondrial-like isoform X3 [Bidens hawaiensis]|uniref:S-adenosylmethionine carrier 1, chloroplastic/mitochondrial-like isoform X3 n=1 Tax=Bidens hawaiensis TaxID=980011 RepID=UPI00404B85F0
MSVNPKIESPDALKHKLFRTKDASISRKEDPFDFVRALLDGAIAGAAAGVVVESALYPLDTIKTRLQTVRGGGQIVLKGLYSGLLGNLAGVLPASAIFIGVYEPTKQKLLKICPENLSALAHLTAGAVGGAASSIIRVPTEGYNSFLLRDLPFDAIQFCIYEQLRIGYKLAAKRDLSDPENAVIGAFAGAITGAVTTPLDVIKTRLMVQGSANQYRSISHCVGTILKEEGPSAFLKGIGPRVMWIGIGGSIFFGVLERTKQLLAANKSSYSDKFN